MKSGGEQNIFILMSSSLSSPLWAQAAFTLISLLGLSSLLSTLSVSLAFLHRNFQDRSRLYPGLVGLLAITISLSLLSFWSMTSASISELIIWAVERLSFLVQGFILATIGWVVGINNIAQRISSARGQFGMMYSCYASVAPVVLLISTVLISLHNLHQRDLTVGCLVLLLFLSCLLTPAAVIVLIKLRRGNQLQLSCKQIWLQEILGRRVDGEPEKSLTNSYRNFERCDPSLSVVNIRSQENCASFYRETGPRF